MTKQATVCLKFMNIWILKISNCKNSRNWKGQMKQTNRKIKYQTEFKSLRFVLIIAEKVLESWSGFQKKQPKFTEPSAKADQNYALCLKNIVISSLSHFCCFAPIMIKSRFLHSSPRSVHHHKSQFSALITCLLLTIIFFKMTSDKKF